MDEENVSRKAQRLDMSVALVDYDEDEGYHKNVVPKAAARLKKMGVSLTPQPMRNNKPLMPELPTSISNLTNTEITDLQAAFVALFGFAEEQRALASARAESYKEEADKVRKMTFLQVNGTQAVREAKSKTSSKFIHFNEKRMEWALVEKLLNARCQTLELARAVCSRDVNFRVTEFDAYKRQQNVAGRRHKDPSFRDPDDWGGDQ
jgi:hypothetical protein